MFPVNLPMVIQDISVASFFVGAALFLFWKRHKKKAACPACEAGCGTISRTLQTEHRTQGTRLKL